MQIQTERLILREWKDSDIPIFIAMNRDLEVMKFFPNLLSEDESQALVANFRNHFSENGFGFFAVELKKTQEFIGFVGIAKVNFEAHFTPAVEIGWRLSSQNFGKGYATEAAQEVLKFAFEELSMKEIVAFTIPENLPSQNVMKKIGMVRDLSGDFTHPKLPKNHKLSLHYLYKISNSALKNYLSLSS